MEIYEHNKLYGETPSENPAPSARRRAWPIAAALIAALLCAVLATVCACRAARPKEQTADGEAYRTAFAAARPSVAVVSCDGKAGSGVVYAIRGGVTYVITNHHVVENAAMADVRFGEREEAREGAVVGFDAYHDIALLAVTGAFGTPAEIGDTPAAGQRVLALGNNLGYGIAAFEGIVSRTDRMLYVKDKDKNVPVFAVTCPVNAGMSGGGAFTLDGKLAGINTYQTNTVESGTRPVDGTSYIVPAAIAELIAQRILHDGTGGQIEKIEVTGRTDSGYRNIGIECTGLYFRAAFDSEGLRIDWVNPVAPDVRGGELRAGDRISRIGGLAVTAQTELHAVFAQCLRYRDTTGEDTQTGEPLVLQLSRDGQTVEITYECKRLAYGQ
ncbi:MAG: serine protease [Clostridia bacterium]|nr:serine protease [Clostridia bacterium]